MAVEASVAALEEALVAQVAMVGSWEGPEKAEALGVMVERLETVAAATWGVVLQEDLAASAGAKVDAPVETASPSGCRVPPRAGHNCVCKYRPDSSC